MNAVSSVTQTNKTVHSVLPEMLLADGSEHSKLRGKFATEEKCGLLQAAWLVTLSVKHRASVIEESMYTSRLSHDKHDL